MADPAQKKILDLFKSGKKWDFGRYAIDRHRGFFVRRRAVTLGKDHADWLSDPAFGTIMGRIDSEITEVENYLATKLGPLTRDAAAPASGTTRGPLYGGPGDATPPHLDLTDVAQVKTHDPAGTIANVIAHPKTQTDLRARKYLDRRRDRVLAIVWRAAALHKELWTESPDQKTATLTRARMDFLLDRRLRLAEHMNYRISSHGAMDKEDNTKPSAPKLTGPVGPWTDGYRVRCIEYPRVPNTASYRTVIGPANIGPATAPYGGAYTWTYSADVKRRRLEYNKGPQGFNFNGVLEPDLTYDPADNYYVQVTPVDLTAAEIMDEFVRPDEDLLAEIAELIRRDDIPRRIGLTRRALRLIDRQKAPELWAALTGSLAMSLVMGPAGDPAGNVEQAIAGLRSILEVFTREAVPGEWAETQNKGLDPPEVMFMPEQARQAEGNYRRSGNTIALDIAVAAWEEFLADPALETAPPGIRWSALNDLALDYMDRYQATGRLSDLDAAIECLQQITDEEPKDSPKRFYALGNFGVALQRRYARRGDLADLEHSLRALESAAEAATGSPEEPGTLNNLGTGLVIWYRRTGDLAALDRAVETLRHAATLAPRGSADEQECQNNLGMALHIRWGHTGAPADLDATVAAFEQALDRTPLSAPDCPRFARNLASGLRTRYLDRNDPADLHRAIAVVERGLTTPGTADTAAQHDALGSLLVLQFYAVGGRADPSPAAEALHPTGPRAQGGLAAGGDRTAGARSLRARAERRRQGGRSRLGARPGPAPVRGPRTGPG